MKRPNILIIYTDQQRFETLGSNQNLLIKINKNDYEVPKALKYIKHLAPQENFAITPNIDSIAKDGANLASYFVNSPICGPSRMSFLTGQYPGQIKIGNNGYPLPHTEVPINQLLSDYGYTTAQIGKLHFVPHVSRDHKNPTYNWDFDRFILSDEPGAYDDAYLAWVRAKDQSQVMAARTSLPTEAKNWGFQKTYKSMGRSPHQPYLWEGKEGFTHTDFVADEVCTFLEHQENKKEPFFCIAGLYAPHSPLNPPKKYVDMYKDKDMPVRIYSKEEEEFLPKSYKDLSQMRKEDWQNAWRHYMALTTLVDDAVGQMINQLKKIGKYEETLIIFTTDHGEWLGDHNLVHKGMPGHEQISHVPTLVSYPKLINKGITIGDFVEGVDIFPTILEFAGVQIPNWVQGYSIYDVLVNGSKGKRDSIFMERFEARKDVSQMVRTTEFKYYLSNDGTEILFDLKNDPKELKNHATDPKYTETLSKMRKLMIERMQKSAYFDGKIEKKGAY